AQAALEKSGAANALESWGERVGTAMGLNKGDDPDTYSASNQGETTSATKEAYENHKEEMMQMAVGNYVWDALKEADFGSWIGASNSKRLREEMMSISGTVIVCVAGEDGCKGPEAQDREGGLVVNPMPPTLDLLALVAPSSYGWNEHDKIWTCP